jgi:hypothetical protein
MRFKIGNAYPAYLEVALHPLCGYFVFDGLPDAYPRQVIPQIVRRLPRTVSKKAAVQQIRTAADFF